MKVNEYIYRNWANWNFAILKQLCEDEGIEWSEELVGYLKKTPTNTNWSLLKDFGIEPYRSDEGGSDTVTITAMAGGEYEIEFSRTAGGAKEILKSGESVTVDKGTTLWFFGGVALATTDEDSVCACGTADCSYTFTKSVTIYPDACE